MWPIAFVIGVSSAQAIRRKVQLCSWLSSGEYAMFVSFLILN